MSKDFFIMMGHPAGTPVPIIGEDDIPVYFETLEEARVCAKNHAGCYAFGYEIFELGNGES